MKLHRCNTRSLNRLQQILQVKQLKSKQGRFPMLILYITNIQDFVLQLNCSISLNIQCKHETVQVAMATWHFGSVSSVSDRKTLALRYCQTPFCPHCSAFCFSVGRQMTEEAMTWNLHKSGSIVKRGFELKLKNDNFTFKQLLCLVAI